MRHGTTRDEMHADLRRREAADGRVFVTDVTTGELTGMKASWRAEQRRNGKIKSARIGNRRMDSLASVYQLLHELIDASYTQDGSTIVPIRRPSSEFKKKLRKPTDNELAGLARANAARHAEAVERRAAKTKPTAEADAST